MTSPLLPFAISAMLSLAPNRDHLPLATVMVEVVESNPPLFARDEDRVKTLSLIIAVAFREGSLKESVLGDDGHSKCTMQIYDGPAALNESPRLCIQTGYDMLRVSVRMDSLNPVAFYARGPRFTSEEAKRISRDRMWLAHHLARFGQIMKD